MKKRIFASLLALVMAFSLLPASALAALNTGHKIDVTFTVLYVDDSFNIGYNYGASEKTQFVCQYTTNHSDTAYNNHTIAISDIKAAANRATVNSGYQIVGWSKESNANPTTWPLNKSGTTACNKGTTIYLVAKNPTPQKEFTLNYDANGGIGAPGVQTGKSRTGSCDFTISPTVPTYQGHDFQGWSTTQDGSARYHGGDTFTAMSLNTTLYAVWTNHVHKDGNHDGFCDGDDHTCMHPKDNNGYCTEEGCTHPDSCCPKKTEPAAPEIPSRDDFQTVAGAGFRFNCVNEEATHNYKTFETTLQNHKDAYRILHTEAQKTNDGRYYFDVEAETAPYLPDYCGSSFAGVDHTLAKDAPAKVTIRFYWNEIDGWKQDKENMPVVNVVCVTEPGPTQPDEGKLYDAIDRSQVLVQCATTENHPVTEMYIGNVDSEHSGIRVTNSEDGTVATVTITNPEDYAAAYKPGNVTHTYKAEGSRLTFTLKWKEGNWSLDGEYPLINTVCESTPEKYTVHYDLNGGKGASGVNYDDVTVSAGDKITVKAAPTRSGYTFKGWKAGNTTYQPGDKLTVNGAITFTAQWSKDSSHDDDDYDYTLRYVTNGGKAISSESKSRSWVKDYEDLPVPTRVGYRFNGWYYDTKLTKAVTGDVQVSSRTVTLYAGWTENSVPAILNGDDHFAYIQGYDDGTVRPNTPVTRAQVATILFRLLDEDVRDKYLTETNTFTDVAADYWANTAISTMANLGVFKGRTADRFDPNAPITRGEFAAVCARFDDSSVQSSNAFSDIDGYWAKQEILRAAALGWVQGYQDGTFRPTASITRAQVVTMINRVLCRQPETASDLLRGMTTFTDCAEGDWCYLAIQEAANSHDYVGKSGSIYESWTDLNKSADWSKYEH